ncbi:MAG: IMP dehydrogenase [Candidatus Cloacimonetes bacterium]|nr:IMP dehydrogenase [Candidatus Cloacimonadota bacterium]
MNKIEKRGYTFDDLLLLPQRSEVLPSTVNLSTRFSRNVRLNLPIVSAAMDTVTESGMAIGMAREGGIGVIHKNLSIEQQAAEVRRVKRYESGVITSPVTLSPRDTIRRAVQLRDQHDIGGFPIIEGKRLVGILTKRDLRFESNLDKKVSELMTPAERLITAPAGISLEEAKTVLHTHRIEKLPIVNDAGELMGMITVMDIEKHIIFPNAAKDEHGRLVCGAAVGVTGDFLERAQELVAHKADVIVIDTAHGHHINTPRAIEVLRRHLDVDLVAGNIATADAARSLLDAGIDAIKVGIGPGSICTTRVVAGIGVPQITAIMDCAEQAAKEGVPVIADGGIKLSGDIVKALAAGAETVMLGSLLAGTDNSPGEFVIYNGRRFKSYRGMGSIGAMRSGSRDRYFQESTEDRKLVAEGIEGMVPYKGQLKDFLFQLAGGLRAGMGYVGAPDIDTLRSGARFIEISAAGLKESHPHDVMVTKEAPNYQLRKE